MYAHSFFQHMPSSSRTPYTPLQGPKSSINARPVDTEYSGLSDIAVCKFI